MRRASALFTILTAGSVLLGADAESPFSGKDRSGLDLNAPTLEDFAASLPSPKKAPGAPVKVEWLEVRQTGRDEAWPSEPSAIWIEGAGSSRRTVETRLNEAAWLDARHWIHVDPSGRALPVPQWSGAVLCVRADETERKGLYSVELAYSRRDFDGWIEIDGRHLPVTPSHAQRTRVRVNNRWSLVQSIDLGHASDGSHEQVKAAFYLRIDDGRSPAAAAPAAQEPSSVTPAR